MARPRDVNKMIELRLRPLKKMLITCSKISSHAFGDEMILVKVFKKSRSRRSAAFEEWIYEVRFLIQRLKTRFYGPVVGGKVRIRSDRARRSVYFMNQAVFRYFADTDRL